MISRKMAENYLIDSDSILSEARAAMSSGHHHRTIRLSQESFKLALKAILRSVGVEYPKEHNVFGAVEENLEKFPGWLREAAPELEAGSTWLSQRRGPSMYGDEISSKPASQLFSSEDSTKAVKYATRADEVARRLFEEMFLVDSGRLDNGQSQLP